MNTYTTTEGTKPQPYAAHEPRTMTRETDGDLSMMTEIGDGVFVAWADCRRCQARVYNCKCAEGPQEPPYIQKWRAERFAKSLTTRPDPSFELLPTILGWVKERGYAVTPPTKIKELLDKGAQPAQDAALGDSNDTEIELLRDALEWALNLLGVDLPEGRDPEDVEEERADELNHTGKHEVDAQAEEDAHEAETKAQVDEGLDAALTKVREARSIDEIEVDF